MKSSHYLNVLKTCLTALVQRQAAVMLFIIATVHNKVSSCGGLLKYLETGDMGCPFASYEGRADRSLRAYIVYIYSCNSDRGSMGRKASNSHQLDRPNLLSVHHDTYDQVKSNVKK